RSGVVGCGKRNVTPDAYAWPMTRNGSKPPEKPMAATKSECSCTPRDVGNVTRPGAFLWPRPRSGPRGDRPDGACQPVALADMAGWGLAVLHEQRAAPAPTAARWSRRAALPARWLRWPAALPARWLRWSTALPARWLRRAAAWWLRRAAALPAWWLRRPAA